MKTRSLLVLSLSVLAVAGLRCSEPTPEDPPDATVDVPADAEALPPGPDAAALPPGPDAGPRLCDPTKCAEGNICVENRCRLECARHTDCPDGYDCLQREGKRVCIENGMPYESGKFGYGCGWPTAVCAEGFRCIGAKNDPNAYCTRSPCADDSECPGSYYCTQIDVTVPTDGGTPDVGKRDTGYEVAQTTLVSICRKRGFCAPATGLVDCNDVDAVYMRDMKAPDGGMPGWCLKTCSGIDPNACGAGNGCIKNQCWPRALTCNPTGTFCSRCLSSDDCPAGGLCYAEGFSKERYCTAPCVGDEDCNGGRPLDSNPGECIDTRTRYGKQCFPIAIGDGIPASCWSPL